MLIIELDGDRIQRAILGPDLAVRDRKPGQKVKVMVTTGAANASRSR